MKRSRLSFRVVLHGRSPLTLKGLPSSFIFRVSTNGTNGVERWADTLT